MLAPPIGGVLYNHFGFRGPFVFALIAAFIDLVSRLIIIEPAEAMKWGVDPTLRSKSTEGTLEETPDPRPEGALSANNPGPKATVHAEGKTESSSHRTPETSEENPVAGPKPVVGKPLPLLQVMFKLLKSSRALVALLISFVYGCAP